MKYRSNKSIKFSFYLITAVILCFCTYFYKSVIPHFLLSILFISFCSPFVNSIEQLGVKRFWAVLIFYAIFFFSLFLIGSLILPVLIKQFKSLAQTYSNFINQENLDIYQLPYLVNIQNIIENIQNLFPFIDFESIKNSFFESSNVVIQRIPNMILSQTGNALKVFSFIFTVPIVSFFILTDYIFLKKKVYSMIPNRYFEISIIIIDKIKGTIGIYLRALLIECTIVGVLATIVLSILGVKFGVLIGIFAGITNVIPYLGPLMGIVLGGVTVLLTGGSTSLFIWTVLGMWGVQLIDNTLIYPLVMGKNTNIHPVFVILSIVAGGLTFGLLGMLLAVPLVFLISVVFILLYKSLKQFEFI